MALRLAKVAAPSSAADYYSTDGTSPITTQHPTTGSAVPVKVYLFNDDAAKRYEIVSVDPTDTTGADESTYIALAPDNAGTAGTYGAAGAALSFANGDFRTAVPFWVRVTTPSVADSQNKTDIKLTVTGEEFAV